MWRINFVQVIKDCAVSGAEQRSVAQVGGVSGAGGYSERCRSDLMVVTCAAKIPRMAIHGADQ